MLACMRVYKEIGFEGVLRPDHVPTLEGDSNDNPCYSSIGRLLAIGYITGLREAVYGKREGTFRIHEGHEGTRRNHNQINAAGRTIQTISPPASLEDTEEHRGMQRG